MLIANAPGADAWLDDATVVRDAGDQRGSIIGLQTALTAAAGDDVLLVAWDMPFVAGELARLIASLLAPPVLAAVPETTDGPQPFCSAYAANALPFVDAQIARGELRMSSLIDVLPVVRRIGAREMARFGDPSRLFFNVNTAADLDAAERMARGT